MGSDDRRLVIVELKGRLGNQLFQFASGYGVARALDARLRFTASEVASADLLLPDVIGEAYREASARDLHAVGRLVQPVPPTVVWRSLAFRRVAAARRLSGRSPATFAVFRDVGRFHPEVFDLDPPVLLRGHLESERYFEGVADEVFAALTPVTSGSPLPEDGPPSVAVSFRRGDYNVLGRALPWWWYEQAVELVLARVGPARLVLLGDDAAFVALAADRLGSRAEVVDGVALAADPVSQLRLMAACDHCVIANSTFAWWGAWIGDRRHHGAAARVVVAPTEFAGDGDRLPERWLRLDAGVGGF